MHVDINDFEVSLGLMYSPENVTTDEKLRELIITLRKLTMPGQPGLTSGQINSIIRRLKASVSTTQEEARVLYDEHREWLSGAESKFSYFESYLNYLRTRGFTRGPLATLKRDTDRVVGFLADPESDVSISKRGLVVGHVQSGKTGNFIGVMCRAADVGYKVIVVLTGTQEDLRRQTQERIDFAFTGRHWDVERKQYVVVGVGKEHQEHPHCATRTDSDFKESLVANISVSGLNTPLVFVCKKNVTMLDNLRSWIEGQKANVTTVDAPFLLIDDEADNASINTQNREDPTRINAAIRDLLLQFRIANYAGYTATPFANIFIEPPTEDDMLHEDLFPRDFIVALEPPSNYVGAHSIFGEDGDLARSLVTIDDYQDVLPESHKQTHTLDRLPASCIAAIHDFFITSAIRYCRGQAQKNMSMMVNVSRFISVQLNVASLILAEVMEIQHAIKAFGEMDREAIQCKRLADIRSVFEQQHPGVEYDWPVVLKALIEFAPTVEVRTINGKSPDKLDYTRHKSGLHVITVGGLALSRGFTLEGLSTTYILRNARAYDTLLQMGRWFGYRDDYADLCRIYMSESSRNWYSYVHEVTTELYLSFYEMARQERKPLNFGLRVRRHSATFAVTASNKMRTAQVVTESVDFQNVLVETHTVNHKDNGYNLALTERLIADMPFRQTDPGNTQLAVLPWKDVSDYLRIFRYSNRLKEYWAPDILTQLVSQLSAEGYNDWHVAVYSGQSERTFGAGTHTFHLQRRACDEKPGPGIIRINAGKMRVASRGAEMAGLSPEQISTAHEDHRADPNTEAGGNVADWYYRRHRSRPLLMIHLIEPVMKASQHGEPVPAIDCLVALGLSIPPCKALASTPIQYAINRVALMDRTAASAPEDEREDDE